MADARVNGKNSEACPTPQIGLKNSVMKPSAFLIGWYWGVDIDMSGDETG